MTNESNKDITFARKRKSYELDVIKYLDELINEYNKNPTNHYKLKLSKGLWRAWF